mmetsp:Transcript_22420/g.45346  ORF Transcript_22420/g.45346 Transcript_22420/m.45346 type:complete len:430 (+) Transcript_22420:155-1444(+)
MPREWQNAVRWTARAITEHGRITTCKKCLGQSSTQLFCAACGDTYCRACLSLDPDQLWDLSFECPGCIIESICHLDKWQPHEEDLLQLAEGWVTSRAQALKPKTWEGYQRSMRHVIQFMRDLKVWIFPVFNSSHARGLCLFFQRLKFRGTSWATMAGIRCALTNASRSAGLPNPWKEFPQLEELSVGLSKELRTPIKCKEGVSIEMIKRMLAYLEHRYWLYQGTKLQRLADVALRDIVALLIGFFGIRRGSELWANRDGTMGLRVQHVSLVPGSHLTLFIQVQKNDSTGRGSEVVIAWVTGSGIPVGAWVSRLLQRLRESNIPRWGPLFCATSSFARGGFLMPAAGTEARFQHRLRAVLRRTFRELMEDESLLSRWSFHSLRRGGATWGFQRGVRMRLVMGQGGWRSEQGVASYFAADLNSRLTVTRSM